MSQNFKFVEQTQALPLIVRKPIAVMNYNLYKKYRHSQNYYYIREINEILSDASTRHVILFKDCLTIDEEVPQLMHNDRMSTLRDTINWRNIHKKQHCSQNITKYCVRLNQFHADIARIFEEPVCTVLNKYFDKKRKYDYFRIAKIIEEENKLNPQKPPKGIVGERPSPANSQESLPQEQEQVENEVVQHTQVLKEISWLKNEKPFHKDASQTINELFKHLEHFDDMSSFSIAPIPKKEKITLDNFLLYIGTKFNKKQMTSPNYKQTHDHRIQELILKQKTKTLQKGQPNYSLHKKNDTKYSIGSIEKKIVFAKDQFNNLSKKSNRQVSTDIMESLTKLDNKPLEFIKNKSKTTVTKNQIKINNIIRDVNHNNTPTPSLHKVSISSTHLKTQQPYAVPQSNNFKLNSLAKLLIEDTYNDQQHNKLKHGAITHRPLSGTHTLFTSYSNRNSPSINNKQQNLQNSKPDFNQIKKGKQINSTQLPQQFGQLAKNLFKKVLNSKKPKPINHIMQSSQQDKVLNQFDKLKINCNSQQQLNEINEKKQHKKIKSDGRALYNKFSIPELGCLTERHEKESPLLNFHSNNSHGSPQQFRRLDSEKQESISKNMKGLMIQQMLKQLAKKNQQNQQKQELCSIIKNSQKIF
ncbi:unnamed protein product (macronuclear) [Paramecium tetraurelia]|uniref:Uncharacterized protein n=1 Tax=Paramecium tetraurelia TaxID=5888 RepID=A0CBR4_PARTE|nr:uncharacterized protein GSPATT00037014001 [Paramecium tetraurelia]CAK68231.1 unnamed protein product [Paramecium tetraurelia]|eukprot:XP_001435628.1 hypothetical protein (macronuclear) [Paramecium tetraurelia strain d4-2]